MTQQLRAESVFNEIRSCEMLWLGPRYCFFGCNTMSYLVLNQLVVVGSQAIRVHYRHQRLESMVKSSH